MSQRDMRDVAIAAVAFAFAVAAWQLFGIHPVVAGLLSGIVSGYAMEAMK